MGSDQNKVPQLVLSLKTTTTSNPPSGTSVRIHDVIHSVVVINVVFVINVVVIVVVAQSTSAKQTLSGWGLTIVCEPIHLGGGDSRRMANTRQCAGSNPQPSSRRASAVTTAPQCAPSAAVDATKNTSYIKVGQGHRRPLLTP